MASAAIFMTVVGAFGSGRAPIPARFGYWLALMLAGWVWGAFIARFIFRRKGWPPNTWLRVAVAALALSIPFSAVVAVDSVLVLGPHFALADIPGLIGLVTTVSVALLTTMFWLTPAPRPAPPTRRANPPSSSLACR